MVATVAFPIAIPGMYEYSVPYEYSSRIVSGALVKVELKTTLLWGIVVSLDEKPKYEKQLKNILEIKGGMGGEDAASLLRFYQWIARYYQCDLNKVFKPFLQKKILGLKAKSMAVYSLQDAGVSGLTKRQAEITGKIEKGAQFTAEELAGRYGISSDMIKTLVQKGVLAKESVSLFRESRETVTLSSGSDYVLTQEQSDVVAAVESSNEEDAKPFLLHGITGSGKTLIYVELAKRTLQKGRQVIVLVPEISLTPQTIQFFTGAIGCPIAVIHSRMSAGERRDSIESILSGERSMIVGVRSAILVPMYNLGLIVVDEEHDASYKQSEMEPRYHARDVAVMRAQHQKARIVLGSATPSLESYHNSRLGKYTLLKLRNRFGEATLPSVTIVDMNQERKRDNWSLFSRLLKQKMSQTLAEGRQIILLLNRRGFSVALLCTKCGEACTCPNCSVSLVYHHADISLKCHQCGHIATPPRQCEKCGGEQMKYKGAAIQKVEEHLRDLFPHARILRMDQDTTRRKGSIVSLLDAFAAREADILLGTQMVSKGLNFPGVKLVGVVQADIGLHLPDFRASERTFQLLSQVAGRAGRKDNLGEVVLQTCAPEDPGIVCAALHDYNAFFDREISERSMVGYPPFVRLCRFIIQGEDEAAVIHLSKEIADFMNQYASRDKVQILGPVPAALSKVHNLFRYSIIARSTIYIPLQKLVNAVRTRYSTLPKTVALIVDIDPVNML